MRYALGKSSAPDPLTAELDVFKPSAVQIVKAKLGLRPKSWSYKSQMGPVYNQGQFGTCVANANAGLRYFYAKKRLGELIEPSRQAIFSQAKHSYESNDIADDGLAASDGIMVELQFGFIPEMLLPYPKDGDDQALLAPVPPGMWIKSDLYRDILAVEPNVDAMKFALAKHGPLIIGMSWPEEWEDAAPDGTMPTPKTNAGGHCVLIVGYDDAKQAFEVRNSWGAEWANGGYFWFPYSLQGSQFFPTDIFAVVC